MTKVQPKELFEQPFKLTSNKKQHNQLLIRNLISMEVILRFSKNRHKTISINKCMKVHFSENNVLTPLPNIPMGRSN